jgi:hypothetical protein
MTPRVRLSLLLCGVFLGWAAGPIVFKTCGPMPYLICLILIATAFGVVYID